MATSDNMMGLLADAVRGKSDEEIEQGAVLAGGSKAVLDLLFEGIRQGIDPAKAEDSVVSFAVKTDKATMLYTLTIKSGQAALESRDLGTAPVVHLATSYADLIRLFAGEIDGMTAVFQQRLQVAGDQALAGRLGDMFGPPASA